MRIMQDTLTTVFGQHVIDNAFFKLDMGDNPRGVFGVAPTYPMHAFESGIVPMLLDVVVDQLPDGHKHRLDNLAEQLFSKTNVRYRQMLDYPRISLRGGFCSLSQLSSDE